MDPVQTRNVLEACLLVAARPMTIPQLDALFEEDIDRPDRKAIREALAALAESYVDRGIELVEVASGWRLQTRVSMEHWVVRLSPEKTPRYSRALLETLVLIAYRQPITRGEIEEVRGVAVSSNIVRTLQDRRWVREVGFKEVPGKPALLGTTSEFLDYFNLKRLDELPPLVELQDIEGIEAMLAAELDVVEGGEAANDEDEEPSSVPDAEAHEGGVSDMTDVGKATASSAETSGSAGAGARGVPGVPDAPAAPDPRQEVLEDMSLDVTIEPEPPGPAGLSLSSVAARFVASTDAGAASSRDDPPGKEDASEMPIEDRPDEEEDVGERTSTARSDGVDTGGRVVTDAHGTSGSHGLDDADDDVDADRDGVIAGTDERSEAPAAVAQVTAPDVAVLAEPERGDPDGSGAAATAVTEVEASESVSGAQTRMLGAVHEFAEEHRRELDARDEWNARIVPTDDAGSARQKPSDAHPGGRPGAVSSSDESRSDTRSDASRDTWQEAPPGRDEERGDSPRDGPATPDDDDP